MFSIGRAQHGLRGRLLTKASTIPAIWIEIRGARNQAVWAALAPAGLSTKSHELNRAVLAASKRPKQRRLVRGRFGAETAALGDRVTKSISESMPG